MELSPPDLDLSSFCLRAVGEWQALDIHQNRLHNLERNKPLLDHEKWAEKYFKKESGEPVDAKDTRAFTNPALRESLKGTLLKVAESNFGNPSRIMRDGFQIFTPGVVEKESPNAQDIMSLRSFLDPSLLGSDYYCEQEMNRYKGAVDALTPTQKAEIYWALRFQNSSHSIVLGILESIPDLLKKGYKNWILPSGDKIELDDLKLGIMEVAPTKIWPVLVEKYFWRRNGAVPSLQMMENNERRELFISRLCPKLGVLVKHYVLEVELPDGSHHILDPTGRRFGYKGRNGVLVIHESLDQYKSNFPGILGFHNTIPISKEMYSKIRNMANGQFKFIDRLKDCIIKYSDRRCCGYCGQIEGLHPESPRNDGSVGYRFETVTLRNCSRCKGIAYCGVFCQKMDWRDHKGQCKE